MKITNKTKWCQPEDSMEDMCMETACDCDMHDEGDMEDMEDMCSSEDLCGMNDMHAHTRFKLAHAYVPWQCYDKAFSPKEALMKGTLFPELWGVYKIPR